MHIYVPAKKRNDLRTFIQYINMFSPGTILRLRTFRPLFGVRSEILSIEELRTLSKEANMHAFERNVFWVKNGVVKREWYIEPGLGGGEMDGFWRRLGMEKEEIRRNREGAMGRMRELAWKKVEGMKEQVRTYEGHEKKNGKKTGRK
jgi:hypothetical protein